MKVSNKQLEEALLKSCGNISLASKMLSELIGQPISRQTVHQRVKKSPRLQEICEQAREAIVDMAESALSDRISEGDTRAIIYALESKGKERGWGKKIEGDLAGLLKGLEERIQKATDQEKKEIRDKIYSVIGNPPPQEICISFVGSKTEE